MTQIRSVVLDIHTQSHRQRPKQNLTQFTAFRNKRTQIWDRAYRHYSLKRRI